MMFKPQAGTNYDGLSIASLAPGIYKDYELKEIKFENTTKADGSAGKEILTFLFDGPQGPHQHTEYEIASDDPKVESKSANLFKRVGHIMSKFVPRATVDSFGGGDFKTLSNWVVNTLNPVKAGVKVEIKVLGNVYNGEARSNFPGYPPFIARTGASDYKPLAFSANENTENRKYAEFQNATPDTEQDVTSSGGGKVDTDF